MKGTLIDYDASTGSGTIKDNRGASFAFSDSNWISQCKIEPGTEVNFKAKGTKKGPMAAQVVPISNRTFAVEAS